MPGTAWGVPCRKPGFLRSTISGTSASSSKVCLTGEGYEVQTASSGEEALHILDREAFDVIITDLVMPGVDGTELVEAVKERDADQDIIMVTGVVDVKTAVEAMKQGATDYILKPFDRNTLTRSLDSILQRRRLREEHARLVAENLEYMEVLSLYERSVGLFSTLSLEPLAERLIEGLCLETRAQGGVLWIASDLGEATLALSAARGLIRVDEEPEDITLEQLGPDFRVLEDHGRPIVRPWRRPEGGGAESALYVPLRHAGELVGVARLSDKLEGSDFDDRDRAAAEKFVGCGSVALTNALRFRALERRSFRDPTTKAYTHAYFEDVVRNEIQKANRFGRHFSLVRVDVGSLCELRRSTSDQQLGHWLECVVHEVGQALRSTDLLAVESERRFSVLLPETDSLGAVILKQRIGARRSSGVACSTRSVRSSARSSRWHPPRFRPTEPSSNRSTGFSTNACTSTGTSLLHQPRHRGAALRHRGRRPPARGRAPCGGAALPGHGASCWRRSAADRETGGCWSCRQAARCCRGCARVAGAAGRVPTRGRRWSWWATKRRSRGVAHPSPGWPAAASPRTMPFVLYYGEGPAYAIVSETRRDNGDLPVFHTSDRTLVEHLAVQLQRDLGIPLGM